MIKKLFLLVIAALLLVGVTIVSYFCDEYNVALAIIFLTISMTGLCTLTTIGKNNGGE